MRLINADELMTQIITLCVNNKQLIDEWLFYNIENEIIDAPTIEAEPVKYGKWLMNDKYGAYCSECGSASFEITGQSYSRLKTKYCWNCGAKMDDEISNIAKESADKISKALDKVKAKGWQTQNIKEDVEE